MKEQFLDQFKDQFMQTDIDTITYDTEFRTIGEWSSLLALCVIAMADENYSVKLTDQDMKACKTVADIYNLVSSRIN